MANLLKVSEAASLALHSMVLIAEKSPKLISARAMAERLNVSEAHLSKVLQRLGRDGLVRSIRGPGGGFTLLKKPEEVTLLDIYESIEGPLEASSCLFSKPVCGNKGWILGGLLDKVDTEVRSYLSGKKLSDLAGVYGEGRIDAQKDNKD